MDELPTSDATGSIAMSGSAGKVVLLEILKATSGTTPENTIDFVGLDGANALKAQPQQKLHQTQQAFNAVHMQM